MKAQEDNEWQYVCVGVFFGERRIREGILRKSSRINESNDNRKKIQRNKINLG